MKKKDNKKLIYKSQMIMVSPRQFVEAMNVEGLNINIQCAIY